jgi:hypothetical protein
MVGALLGAALVAPGCDGMVSLDGWAVKGEGGVSTFTPSESGLDRTMPPESALTGVEVQLWTSDGKKKLDGIDNGPDGFFSVGKIGRYEPDLKYLLKALKSGYKPLSVQVTLQAAQTCHGTIVLVPETPLPAFSPDLPADVQKSIGAWNEKTPAAWPRIQVQSKP